MITPRLQIRLLGPVGVSRGDVPVPLPRSRKVRGLLAFLALAPSPSSRSRLCDLFWDVPNDPRSELRWCLSKLRAVLEDDEHRRVISTGKDLISLDLTDCGVDALEVERTVAPGVEQVSKERLSELRNLMQGDLLEGLELDESPEFSAWLGATRQRHRAMRIAVLRELSLRSPRGSEEATLHLEALLQLAPFEQRAHEAVLDALTKSGRAPEAEQHLARAIRAFEKEGLDWRPLREAFRASRSSDTPEPAMERSVHLIQVAAKASPVAPGTPVPTRRRASIAVMPFVDSQSSDRAERRRVADGLTEDIITRLAKLRVLFVIARGTVFALGEQGIGAQEAGRILNVDYVASGSVRRQGDRVSIVVELAETSHARIVWTDELEGLTDETFSALDAIVNRIVSVLAEEIEAAECQRALLRPPSSLDAWESYHRGLWHMYKFNGPDNAHAQRFFQSAIALDPTFARAYAGLSFTHFQNAFLDLTPDRMRQVELSLEVAGQSLSADERDPAAHWAMGRALWLNGAENESFAELRRSVELSPNFALGHYTLGFVYSQTGDPRAAIEASDHSRELSPFDPLQFAMLASRALAHVRLGELTEAAHWAVKATGRPNAHAHILAIAAQCLALTNRPDEARKFVARIRQRVPNYSLEDFLRAFRFDRPTTQLFRRNARQIGFETSAG
jgi:DNA-binding SARP family transcriptional activator/TolB-like protein